MLRTNRVTVYLSDQELEKIRKDAGGVPVPVWLRAKAVGAAAAPAVPEPEPQSGKTEYQLLCEQEEAEIAAGLRTPKERLLDKLRAKPER